MTISPVALAAKKVIDAAWLHGDAYDLSSQAAFALESAQLLMSPEIAEELERLRARVAELEYVAPSPSCTRCYGADAKRFVAQGGATAPCSVCAPADGITRRIAPTQALREEEDVTPQVRKLRDLLAGQRAAVEDDPYGLHHTYRVSRDLPETDGAR